MKIPGQRSVQINSRCSIGEPSICGGSPFLTTALPMNRKFLLRSMILLASTTFRQNSEHSSRGFSAPFLQGRPTSYGIDACAVPLRTAAANLPKALATASALSWPDASNQKFVAATAPLMKLVIRVIGAPSGRKPSVAQRSIASRSKWL